MSATAVQVRDLTVDFKIRGDRALGLKEAATHFRIASGVRTVKALRQIDLEIQGGDSVGLVGENGSGKSTLLRCIAGIIPPTLGSVLVSGSVSSLIELGAGFHPELTGRENAMVTGILFGLTRRTLLRRLDEIVSFAGLEEVIDQPIRSYSSGMYVRLAFSLAVHVEPKILLIDEVLAVGDEAFQRKCVEKVRDLSREGMTVVFVSHDLDLVQKICPRSVWLHHGSIVSQGPTSEAIKDYLAQVDQG